MPNQQYFLLDPDQIVQSILRQTPGRTVFIQNIEFFVHPNVYPSDKFRTTDFLLTNLLPLIENKTLCDMGCGIGVVGHYALKNGARKIVQADINPFAVKNAEMNKKLHQAPNHQMQIYESNCFDNIPPQIFDLIVFNIPFHTENVVIQNPLEYAFHDPDFSCLKKFLSQISVFSDQNTKIIIAFSNKGDIKGLENIFDEHQLNWELWRVANADQKFDNRLYLIRCK